MPLSEQEQLTRIKEKRILKEIKDIQEIPIDPDNSVYEASPGCYVWINDADMTNHKIMIIGPKDTPYEHGFYMFNFTYHTNHPFEAPQVTFLTTDGTVRFNPNLYSNGKVCLSILGTWSGPAWEPTMSLRVVCEYLRSILNEKPIQNEPGFDHCVDNQCTMYNYYVTSENYYQAIFKNVSNLCGSLSVFNNTINLKFIENFSQIINKLKTLNNIDKFLGKSISPYSKELRYSIKKTTSDLIFQFLGIYHFNNNKLFKHPQLFNTELIKKVYEENKNLILNEIVKLCIENIDKTLQDQYTPIELLVSIYKHMTKIKDQGNNYNELKKFIIIHYNAYNPDTKFNDFIKNDKSEELLFDVTLELILMNIDFKILPKNINIMSNGIISKCLTTEAIDINELYD